MNERITLAFLRIMRLQGKNGYYARCLHELELLTNLETQHLVTRKRNRKKIFVLTEKGQNFIDRLDFGRKDISEGEFTQSVKEAFQKVTNPMRPIARIPELRSYVTRSLKCSDQIFDKFMLRLHDQGVLTLQTAMTLHMTNDGINTSNGTYAYCMLEED
ncbi:MAG: hypothetical protein ACFFDT_26400 [Candidatus Hodarchaeota archaeon]